MPTRCIGLARDFVEIICRGEVPQESEASVYLSHCPKVQRFKCDHADTPFVHRSMPAACESGRQEQPERQPLTVLVAGEKLPPALRLSPPHADAVHGLRPARGRPLQPWLTRLTWGGIWR